MDERKREPHEHGDKERRDRATKGEISGDRKTERQTMSRGSSRDTVSLRCSLPPSLSRCLSTRRLALPSPPHPSLPPSKSLPAPPCILGSRGASMWTRNYTRVHGVPLHGGVQWRNRFDALHGWSHLAPQTMMSAGQKTFFGVQPTSGNEVTGHRAFN